MKDQKAAYEKMLQNLRKTDPQNPLLWWKAFPIGLCVLTPTQEK